VMGINDEDTSARRSCQRKNACLRGLEGSVGTRRPAEEN
jgi:hypothetical protein